MVIDLALMRDLVEGGADRIVFDTDGEAIEAEDSSAVGPAVLLVDEVTDAVKQVEGDRIIGSLDRKNLWAIRRFELDREVVLDLDTGTVGPEELVEVVKAAGYRWRVVPVSPSDP